MFKISSIKDLPFRVLLGLTVNAAFFLNCTEEIFYNFPLFKSITQEIVLIKLCFTVFYVGLWAQKRMPVPARTTDFLFLAPLGMHLLFLAPIQDMTGYGISVAALAVIQYLMGQWVGENLGSSDSHKKIDLLLLFGIAGVIGNTFYYFGLKNVDFHWASALLCFALLMVLPLRALHRAVAAGVIVASFTIYSNVVDQDRFANFAYRGVAPYVRVFHQRTSSGITDIFKFLEASTWGPKGLEVFLYNNAGPSHLAVKDDPDTVNAHVRDVFGIKTYPRVLVMGLGGGQDIVMPLLKGSTRIDAVEADAKRVELMQTELLERTNFLLKDPRVQTYVMGGRRFLRETDEKYDLISVQRSLLRIPIATWVYDQGDELLTTEAIAEYMKRLTPDGMLFIAQTFVRGEEAGRGANDLLVSLNSHIDEIKDKMIVYRTYNKVVEGRIFLNILIPAKPDPELVKKIPSTYEVIYHGGSPKTFAATIADVMEFDVAGKIFNDRSLFQARDTNLYLLPFLGVFLVMLFATFWSKTGDANFLVFGIGSEFIPLTILIALTRFHEFNDIFYPGLIVFYLINIAGYRLAARSNGNQTMGYLAAVAGSLGLLLSLIIFDWIQVPSVHEALLWILFAVTAFVSAVPFGYFLRQSVSFERSLFLDAVGGIAAYVLVIFLKDLAYITLMSLCCYVALLAYAIFGKRFVRAS